MRKAILSRDSRGASIFWLTLALAAGRQAAAQETPPETRGAAVAGTAPGDSAPGYIRRHALVIGIDTYEDPGFPDLSYAAKDARDVAQALSEQFGFERVRLILNGDATQDGLLAALEEWAADPVEVGPDDLFVMFYAGHGVNRELPGGSARGYLVPADARRDSRGRESWGSLIGMNQVEETSRLIPAKHGLFLVDCCFGGLTARRSAMTMAPGLDRMARQVLTAGDASQTVLDGGGAGNSVFTGALLESFRGDADANGDDVLTFGELYFFVGRAVEFRTGAQQTPLQATLDGHEGGSVSLFAPGTRPVVQTAAERLRALERTVEEQLEELLSMADGFRAARLLEQASGLWPRRPRMVPSYRRWLGEAKALLARKTEHQSNLAAIRQEAYLSQVVAGIVKESEQGTVEPDWEQVDTRLAWRFDTTRDLLRKLTDLEALVTDISDRLQVAETIVQRSIGVFEDEWEEAITEILLSEHYGGLEIEPQVGLVPIGPDPDSGLWEFWHVETGERPLRDKDSGELTMTGDTGMVLVLLPGGTFTMGAQKNDPAGLNYEAVARVDETPLCEIALSPFFLSKYEMTQGQWYRVLQERPSYYGLDGPGGDDHPVESVSWHQSAAALRHVGLAHPTEAQWEYAVRAGTSTSWWCGGSAASIGEKTAGNLFDRGSPSRHPESRPWGTPMDWVDPYTLHAPVGRFAANAFGLHDVIGNVWEWCADLHGTYDLATREGDGLRVVFVQQGPGPLGRVNRGGSFSVVATDARSALRSGSLPDHRSSTLGVRAARALQ